MPVDEASWSTELLLTVDRNGPATLGAQVETQLRDAIRQGVLRPATQIPSTRDLARQLGISRRVVVDAYAQLAAEGYLTMRQGARPRVSDAAAAASEPAPAAPAPPPRYDFRPSVPDVSAFPRAAWLRSLKRALSTLPDAGLGYGDPCGDPEPRAALAAYLGRVRGVVADPGRVVITCGFGQAQGVVCQALARAGAQVLAIEDPSNLEPFAIAERAGLTPVRVPVDDEGLRVDALPDDADAVLVTPAHQHPTGVVLSPERRAALVAWLRERDAIAIEDDYDAEYRYDRAAVGALQGLEPERVVYAGSASKTLAPALRLGWLVVPQALVEPVRQEKYLADQGTSRIEQLAFADFLERGELDRHLRRMRARYRDRRDALIEALNESLPEVTVRGIAAGLHVNVELPEGVDDRAIQAAASERRITLRTMRDYSPSGPPTLMLGYGQLPEPAIRAGVRELAALIA